MTKNAPEQNAVSIISRTLLCAAVLLLLWPAVLEARHNSRVDTSDLDDDAVEEMPIPVLFGVEYDDIVPDFGDPRGGGSREHEGQDMRAPQGTPIVSPTESVVLRTGTGESAGKYVYTANPGGEQFRYMHLDSIADIDRGDELDVGDLIGTVGDTGNAPEDVHHLHFEILEDRSALDPYPRLTAAFTLKEKVSFLSGILRDIDEDEDEYAAFLVDTFPDVFREALEAGYQLPDEVEEALEDAGVSSRVRLQQQLQEVIARIPQVLQMELYEGDSGSAVVLLQLYLIYTGDGESRDALAAAGATGYFGPITAAAVREFQEQNNELVTGVYDTGTRALMLSV